MLARVAENLYWMGRYLERAECNMRYIREEFFSTLEAPMTPHRDYVIRSILFLGATNTDSFDHIKDAIVWKNAIFDMTNSNSIISNINQVRENARGIRNTISSELWESINKWYIYCKDREAEIFTLKEINDFSEDMTNHLAMIKYSMVNTQLHNLVWHFLNIGIMLERTVSLSKILRSKISDYNILSNQGKDKSMLIYQWTILLKSVGGYDVHQTVARTKLMSPETMFPLLIANELFPRSLKYSISKCASHLKRVGQYIQVDSEKFNMTDTLIEQINEIDQDIKEQLVIHTLEQIQEQMSEYHFAIHSEFFE